MKRVLITVVTILIVLVAAFYFLSPNANENHISIELPKFFPKEIISDSYIIGLEVLNNTIKLENEQERVGVNYKSHRNVAENTTSIKDYLNKNGFAPKVEESKDSVFIFGTKEKEQISATVWKRSPVQVSILYILLK